MDRPNLRRTAPQGPLVDREALQHQTEHLIKTYAGIWPEVARTWWFLDLPQVFGWRATLVGGDPTFFVVSRMTIPLSNPMIGMLMDDLARTAVDKAAYRVGWRSGAKFPQTLGLVEGAIRFEYNLLVERDRVELTGGLGFRVL